MKTLVKLLSILALLGAFTGAAHAQATRTWVSGVGDDANPCSRTAPCKTFAGAISKTAVGGIINCLDPGGFGAVTITKSITIDCSATLAGVLASGTNGINVVVASTDVVTLRGLNIEGTGTGLIGVSQTTAGTLHIENCRIYGFNAGSAAGIRFAPNAGAKLFVSDSQIADNGVGSTGGGIVVVPSGSGYTYVVLRRVDVTNNAAGIVSDTTGGSNAALIQFTDSTAGGNTGAGVYAVAGAFNSIFLDRASSVQNGGAGVSANGANAQIVITNSTMAGNSMGASIAGGAHGYSYLTNNINANLGPDGTPLPSTLYQY